MKALPAKLVKRKGGNAIEGPPPKKSRSGQRVLAPIPWVLMVDLEASSVTEVVAK